MKRRKFITRTVAGCAAAIVGPFRSLAMPSEHTTVVAHGTDLAGLTNQAFGILDVAKRFEVKRSRVLLKPVMAWDQLPGSGYNSDPALVDFLVRLLVKAGAREVALFDQCYQNWTSCYSASGIERIAKDATGRVYPGNDQKYYQQVGDSNFRVHQSLARADLVLNLAVAAQRGEQRIDGAMASYLRSAWDFENCTPNGNNDCLQRLMNFRKPDLTVTEVWEDTDKGNTISTLRKKGVVVSLDLLHAEQETARLLELDNSSLAGTVQLETNRLWKIHPDQTSTYYL